MGMTFTIVVIDVIIIFTHKCRCSPRCPSILFRDRVSSYLFLLIYTLDHPSIVCRDHSKLANLKVSKQPNVK